MDYQISITKSRQGFAFISEIDFLLKCHWLFRLPGRCNGIKHLTTRIKNNIRKIFARDPSTKDRLTTANFLLKVVVKMSMALYLMV